MLKLNIGSSSVKGSPFENNWTNIDFSYDSSNPQYTTAKYIKADITQSWPIESDSVDCIFASHIFEHIDYNLLLQTMLECYRTLKHGSPMRIICPDPRKFIINWQAKNMQYLLDCYGQENFDVNNYKQNPHIGFSDMFFHDHYDHYLCSSIDLLTIFLIRAGFSKITELTYSNTEFPQFFGGQNDTLDNRPWLSFYLECVK